MAANLMELSDAVKKSLDKRFEEMGLELSDFNFENVSLPAELEKAMDESARLGMLRRNVDVYTQLAQADALKDAAKNPGMAGSTMSAGIGLGMGRADDAHDERHGRVERHKRQRGADRGGDQTLSQMRHADCRGRQILHEMRHKNSGGGHVRKCGAALVPGAKFCPECGAPTSIVCSKCGAKLNPNAKFCPECGEKVK